MNESNLPQLLHVPPAQCVPAPWFNRTDLALTPEFLADIKANGVQQSLLVRPMPKGRFFVEAGRRNKEEGFFLIDRASKNSSGAFESIAFFKTEKEALGAQPLYEIIAGVRRWTAARKGELASVPVQVKLLNDQQAREARLKENLQREALSALDEARQYQDAIDTGAYGSGATGVVALAASVGKSRSHVYARLRLLQLGAAVKAAFLAGKIPHTVAELLATLPGETLQATALQKVLENGPYSYDDDEDFEEAPTKGGRKTAEQLRADLDAQEQATREPMSYRQVKAMLNNDFRLDLKDRAHWKLDDATLLPSAGACLTCPKRSGTDPAAFPEIKNPNLCTDPDCFAAKRAVTATAALKSHVDKGHKVMTPEEHSKAFPSDYGVGGGWVQADHYVYGLKGDRYSGKHANELLGKSMPAPTYGVDGQGKIRALYRKKDIEQIARDKGLLAAEKKADKPPAKETPEAKAKREAAETEAKLAEKIERKVARELVNELLLPIEQGKNFGTWLKPLCSYLFKRLDDCDQVSHDLVNERHGWEKGHPTENVKELNGWEALAAVVESFLVDDPGYSREYEEAYLEEIAKILGVKLDRKAIEKEVRQELTPKPAAAPTAKKPKPIEQFELPAVKAALATPAKTPAPPPTPLVSRSKPAKPAKAKKPAKVKSLAKK